MKYPSSYIFNKKKNNKFKLISTSLFGDYFGATKYFPPFSKEWKNSVYTFNINNIRNLTVYDLNIHNLIKSYFNTYLKKKLFFTNKWKKLKKKHLSLNRIYVSKSEIKHTNTKAIITIYTYNIQKLALLRKTRKLRKKFFRRIFRFFFKSQNYYLSNYLKSCKKVLSYKTLLLRRFKLKLHFNKYKFEENFLYFLANIISKYFNKIIEFNIIKLKCISLNSDIFTNLIALKIGKIQLKHKKLKFKRKKWISPLKPLNFVLRRIVLPRSDNIKERTRIIKSVDFSLLENKYKSFYLSNITKNNWFTYLKNSNLYPIINQDKIFSNLKLYNIIFNTIKYKNINGSKLEIRGRLTTRYRADRATFRLRRKGSLQNIDSAYAGKSSIILKGYTNANVEYSMFASKRRIGAFAVKGWISGK